MTNEEMQRAMEFILEQQARLTASQQTHSAQIAEHSAQIALHSAQIAAQGQEIQQLGTYLTRTIRIVEEMGRQTDERINVLIGTIERYFSDPRRN